MRVTFLSHFFFFIILLFLLRGLHQGDGLLPHRLRGDDGGQPVLVPDEDDVVVRDRRDDPIPPVRPFLLCPRVVVPGELDGVEDAYLLGEVLAHPSPPVDEPPREASGHGRIDADDGCPVRAPVVLLPYRGLEEGPVHL
jgi:hypothetical protein